MQRWWELWPGRLQAELSALDAAGFPYKLDEAAFEKGIVRLEIQFLIDGRQIPLFVTFPDLYPYFRFEVEAPTLSLQHHQNPFGKNLCLIGRATETWRPRDTVAGLLLEQMPTVLETGQSQDITSVAGKEEPQAEPFEAYVTFGPSILMVQSDWVLPPEIERGFLKIGAAPNPAPPHKHYLRGVVLEVQDDQHQIIAQADSAYSAFSDQIMMGRWFRAPDRFNIEDPRDLLTKIPQWDRGGYYIQPNRVAGGFLKIYGVLHPDEVSEYRTIGEAWFFICEYRFELTPVLQKSPSGRKHAWARR